MMRYCLSAVIVLVCLGYSAAYSIPIQCQAFICADDTVCVVVASDNCTGNCPALVAQCEPISSKVGECPETSGVVPCESILEATVCLTDRDCSEDLKCCGGCCRAMDSSDIPTELLQKPGNCPRAPYQGRVIPPEVANLLRALVCSEDHNVNKCQWDAQCPGIDKCCPGACGLTCKKVFSTVSIESRLKGRTQTTTTTQSEDDLKKIPKPRGALQVRPQIAPPSRRLINVQALPRPIPKRA